MRPHWKEPARHRAGWQRRHADHLTGRVAVALIVVAVAGMVAAASASAGSGSLKTVSTGDVAQKTIVSERTQAVLLGLPPFGVSLTQSPAARLGPGRAVGNGVIFYDGFETSSPPWLVDDDPTWGITDYRHATGSYSAYCAGSAIAPPGPYANNMDAWLVAGPLNLASVTAATFSYQFYCVTELNHDYFWALVSLDAVHYYGRRYSGSFDGWNAGSIDLTAVPTIGNVCGKSAVYVAFSFDSDALTTAEGAYVDEVRVTAGTPAPAARITKLTPSHGPTGTAVVVEGANLGSSGTVRFGSTPASTSAWSSASIACTVPASLSPGAVNVTVTPTGGVASNALSFIVDPPPATLQPVDLTISGQPKTVGYKGPVTVSGTLSDATTKAPLGHRSVRLWWTYDPTDYDSWLPLGYVDSAAGQFSMRVSGLERRTYFSWYFEGDTVYEKEWSDDLEVMARAKLTAPGFPKVVRRGQFVDARGTLWPRHTAGQNTVRHTRVDIYRYSRGKYRKLGSVWAKASSATSATTYTAAEVRLSTAGQYRARAIHQDADHAQTTSAWRYFRVI